MRFAGNRPAIEAAERGLKVPEQLAVMGFGDMDFSRCTSPAISTVRIGKHEIGELAAKALLAKIEGQALPERIFDVGFELIERGST